MSFLLPILVWSLVSYVPFLWHPKVEIADPGSVSWFKPGMLVDRDVFAEQQQLATQQQLAVPEGIRANPIYLPAPHEVAIAFYTAFTTAPTRSSEQWLHESLWHSIQVIFWGFTLSSLLGVPIGILCGTYVAISKLHEPFIEFFRYLPAPAFGALAVAILGIHDGPEDRHHFYRHVFPAGADHRQYHAQARCRVAGGGVDAGREETAAAVSRRGAGHPAGPVPRPENPAGLGVDLPDCRRVDRHQLGITWFITQQARYKNFDNVYAAIIMIGIIGVVSDLLLAQLGKRLFPWEKAQVKG